MCGGCSGHKHELEDDIAEDDMPKGASESTTDIARRQVAHDTLEPTPEMKRLMKDYGKGTVPGAFEQWAKAQLAPSEVPWQKVLAPLVRNAVAYVRGRIEQKYGRPSRRRIAIEQVFGDDAPILPGHASPVPKVGIVIDASGSMQAAGRSGRTVFDEALSEVGAVVLATGCATWAAAVDATVQAWVLVKTKDDLQKLMKGGGGTDMRVGIKAAEERKFDVIVLVTDGYTPWPALHEMPRRARLVTCVVGEAEVPAHIRPLVRVNPPKKEAK
jgi:predicted metal-dependent peptidase